ncbi:hypothetical protein CP985_09730 [Malaciobacter mytili LMG 24559]|uniref:Uncharacterized protein n=1 Tax=Malaciobacter mytili LMG 24559 TaxID=1032238 RepID=A0AAX2AGH4_9BACT|nr:hypothetical protein [Malaciobacter mytili]AXH15187.1 hypothetical protein AMYT_1612 [Malaciobacter mytili LMG 24559]RXK15244.1 hypothetical protein CP985_09730 [Malaciobacter mytili LMG 24559]
MNRLKKILLSILIIFIVINTLAYIGAYSNYLKTAPKELKETREYFVIAYLFSVYETLAVKLGISFQNPILKPIQKSKEYFYYKGKGIFPKDDAEIVYWNLLINFYPKLYSINQNRKFPGELVTKYGLDFTSKLLDEILENLEILSKYEIKDYKNNKFIRNKTIWLTSYIFDIYIYNFHLLNDVFFYENKVYNEAKDDEKIKKVILAYKFYKNIFQKEVYQKEINLSSSKYEAYRTIHYTTLFVANSLILFNSISHLRIDCNKELIEDFKFYKSKIKEQILKDKDLTVKEKDNINFIINEIHFIKVVENIVTQCLKFSLKE